MFSHSREPEGFCSSPSCCCEGGKAAGHASKYRQHALFLHPGEDKNYNEHARSTLCVQARGGPCAGRRVTALSFRTNCRMTHPSPSCRGPFQHVSTYDRSNVTPMAFVYGPEQHSHCIVPELWLGSLLPDRSIERMHACIRPRLNEQNYTKGA